MIKNYENNPPFVSDKLYFLMLEEQTYKKN